MCRLLLMKGKLDQRIRRQTHLDLSSHWQQRCCCCHIPYREQFAQMSWVSTQWRRCLQHFANLSLHTMLYKTTKSNCLVLKLNKIYFKKCYSESGMLAWPWMGGELGQSERAKIKENKFIFPSFLSAVMKRPLLMNPIMGILPGSSNQACIW